MTGSGDSAAIGRGTNAGSTPCALTAVLRQYKNAVASLTPPIGKLVRYYAVTTRDINNTNTRLKAFRHNSSLHIIRRPPVTAARLNNLVPTNKSIIHHSASICAWKPSRIRTYAAKSSRTDGTQTGLTLHRRWRFYLAHKKSSP